MNTKDLATHLKGYKKIMLLLWKYGHSDLVKQLGLDGYREAEELKPSGERANLPEQFADDLEAMGPTYVKIGQLLSSRSDLLPESYLKALARLQDNVKPFSYQEVEHIVQAELKVRISKAFSCFDPKPLAAASLGQVHAAALRDGRPVIVKVQRPNIRAQIAEDFEVLRQIAEFLDSHTEIGKRYHFLDVLEEFRITILRELNYQQEAQNLISLGQNLKEFKLIQVPQPIPDYTTGRLLTMEYVAGTKITSLSGVVRLDLKDVPLAEELFKAYLKQIMVDGMFHADPHPGNILLTANGRIALLDLGMVGRVTPEMQENLLRLLICIAEANGEQAADVVIQISKPTAEFDQLEFRSHVARMVALEHNQSLQRINVGRSLLDLSKSAMDNGLCVPSQLTLLGKTLMQLDAVGKILDPTFDPYAAVRSQLRSLMAQRLKKSVSEGNIMNSLLEVKSILLGLPTKLTRLMDTVGDPNFEVKIRAVDAKIVLEGFQKIANRITAGIILAALILGASLMMRIQTSFQIFGYPGLAILCFVGAAAGGIWLLFSIFFQDEKIKRDR